MRDNNGRQRMMDAFSPEGAREFPVLVPYQGIFLRDHWSEVTSLPWWADRAGDPEMRLSLLRDLLRAVDMDWVAVGMGPSRAWCEQHVVVSDGERVWLQHRRTGKRQDMRPEPIGGTQSSLHQVLVHTPDDIERLLPLAPHTRWIEDGSLDHPRRCVAEFGDRFVCGSIGTPFWVAHAYLGFEGLMVATLEKPELLRLLVERITDRGVESVRAYAAAGVHGMFVEDCFSSADLLSPEQFRRFALPYVERILAEIEGLGMRSVYYFCGDVRGRLEDLIAVKPSALSLEESKKGFRIDLGEVAEQVRGRCALLGNLDATGLLERGDFPSIRRAVEEQAAVGRRWPRFAFSLGSPVTAHTSLLRVQYYIKAARKAASAAATG